MKVVALKRFMGAEGDVPKGKALEVSTERGAKLIAMGYCSKGELKEEKVEAETKEEKRTFKTKGK